MAMNQVGTSVHRRGSGMAHRRKSRKKVARINESRLSPGALDRLVLRVLHPPVIDGGERFDEAVFHRAELLQGQAAFVELAVEEAFHGQVVDQALNAGGGRVRKSTAGAF